MLGGLHKLPAGEEVPERIYAVVETPKGSMVRYAFHRKLAALHMFAHVRGPHGYPADYGFVPSTMAQDGQLLDIFVLCEEPTFPGCIIECRPVGVLHLSDGSLEDSKILAVPCVYDRFNEFTDLKDLPEGTRETLEGFFSLNPHLAGREESVAGWGDAKEAKDVVFKAWEGFLV